MQALVAGSSLQDGSPAPVSLRARLLWLVAAITMMIAARSVSGSATPIDQALPLLAATALLLAWTAGEPAIAIAGPLLMVVEISVAEEQARLILMGVVLTGAFAAALARKANPFLFATLALGVLRWIPPGGLVPGRELLLLGALLLLIALQGKARAPLSVVAAIALAFITPAAPTRALMTPWVVAALYPLGGPVACLFSIAAVFTRPSIRELLVMSAFVLVAPRLRSRMLQAPFMALAALAMTFFAWSGVVARGPAFFVIREGRRERSAIDIALAASQSATIALPAGTTKLIVSGSTISPMRRGKPLGRIEPGGIEIRVGDAADWGYMRPEHWFRSRNTLPRMPAGSVHGYGNEAWAEGAGVVALGRGARVIRVTADPHLPANARLQIEASE